MNSDRDPIAGVVLLGYPLHPPGRPEELRTKHLRDVQVPMLFVQGSRDAFGTPDELRPVIDQLKVPVELCVIEGGDHSFKAPKKFGKPPDQICDDAMNEIDRWVRTL